MERGIDLEDIILRDTDISKIYESGQCFGISKNDLKAGEYWCTSGSRFCRVVSRGTDSVLSCFKKDKDYWWNYFDMDTDYGIIRDRYRGDSEISEDVVGVSEGLRMLKQELPDCLISFMTSQRKSVPAIRTAISKFCETYGKSYNLAEYFGEEYEGYTIYTFPSKDRLGEVKEEILEELGFGYRAPYITSCIGMLGEDWMNVNYLSSCGYEEAKSQLKRLYGVGEKIANCVLLYALGYREAYPRDVWILRFENWYCGGHFDDEKYRDIVGIIQLWQYYFILH